MTKIESFQKFLLNLGRKKNPKKCKVSQLYNCARVYIGSYVGGGTNEFEKSIQCKYNGVSGRVRTKKLRPVRIKDTTSEGKTRVLQTIVIYPTTDVAFINVSDSRGLHRLELLKVQKGERSSIFKARL